MQLSILLGHDHNSSELLDYGERKYQLLSVAQGLPE